MEKILVIGGFIEINCDFVTGTFLYPIRVGWQTVFKQNKRQFYMHITEGHETNETQPGYRCTSGSKYSDIESTPSVAITSLYKTFFNTKTRFSVSLILGWDGEKLLEISLKDVYFCALEYEKKRSLFVQRIEKNNCQITIYTSENNSITFCGTNPDDTWKNVRLYKKFRGMELFGLEHSITQKIIHNKQYVTCTSAA
ncbi:1212_t:CDS:2 [Diversispora eburnea]|uniref:1212_t:CDS:1 n=1 Tax=Diversispora eburnea TaxID=1213867 RepID=A0A9N9G691_9GLOM|nr:1212_t:CDS:2 [Diversispora eburnea]